MATNKKHSMPTTSNIVPVCRRAIDVSATQARPLARRIAWQRGNQSNQKSGGTHIQHRSSSRRDYLFKLVASSHDSAACNRVGILGATCCAASFDPCSSMTSSQPKKVHYGVATLVISQPASFFHDEDFLHKAFLQKSLRATQTGAVRWFEPSRAFSSTASGTFATIGCASSGSAITRMSGSRSMNSSTRREEERRTRVATTAKWSQIERFIYLHVSGVVHHKR
jgi:hypothetical protein